MFRFTIDKWLDPYLWPSQVHRFPKPMRRLLGGHSPPPAPDYWIWLETLVASFCGIAVIEGVFKSHTAFSEHHAPLIVASYGASAILCFNASQAPLAQPRNALVGHIVSSTLGVCIQKLFLLSQAGRDHYWAGGALSVAVSSVVMSILNCVHPPGGASALLPCLDDRVRAMGWWYLPVQLVSSVLMIAVACISGNVVRKYPVFWWSPATLGRKRSPGTDTSPVEKQPLAASTLEQGVVQFVKGRTTMEIGPDAILVPEGAALDELELEWLMTLQKCLPGRAS